MFLNNSGRCDVYTTIEKQKVIIAKVLIYILRQLVHKKLNEILVYHDMYGKWKR